MLLAGFNFALALLLPRLPPSPRDEREITAPRLTPAMRCQISMGVPGFCTWIDDVAPTASHELSEDFSASVIAFDMNAILHTQLRRAFDEEHAQVLVFARLHATLRLVRPGATVLLAVDGPAPVAKLSTQRQRRARTARRELVAAEKIKDRDERPRGISSLVATPGTKFMRRFEEALLFFVCSELSTYRARGLRFLVSGADVPGEGEIKLLGAMRQFELTPGGRPRTCVLVGSDGDLVLQGLTMSGWDVSVLQALPERGRPATVISVQRLRDALGLKGMENLDLIALCTFMGNDYLPKMREVRVLPTRAASHHAS